MKLFVYGTLRARSPMHGLMAGQVHPLGPARVHARLLDLGAFPGLVGASAADDWVQGELYAIEAAATEEVLDRLDRYEGDSFERIEDTVVDAAGAEVRASLYRYLGDLGGGRLVVSGDWLAHIAREDETLES